jgi:predicted acyltransferase
VIAPPIAEVPRRLDALDVLRGLTIAGMLVVNTPGTWEHVYPPLLHADWHGWTYTDTIFPFFLFVVGVSMTLSTARRRERGDSRAKLLRHTLVRAAGIFAIGLAINALSFLAFHRAHLRIPGVLQRIAVCYLVAALVYLFLGPRALLPAAAVLLFGYWALMTRVPVPGFGTGRLDPQGNLAAYVDRRILGTHTWKPGWDPEGPLSTLPAVASTLFGAIAGEILLRRRTLPETIVRLSTVGGAAGLTGAVWGTVFPINKNLWTSSYAMLMAGLAAIALALGIWAVDFHGWRTWAAPFRWLGLNALAIFVASDLAAIVLLWIKVAGPDGKPRSLYAATYRTVFDRFTDPRLGSLLFALAFLSVFVAVAGVLYKKRIFIKI